MLVSYGLQMSTNPITLQRSHAQYRQAIRRDVLQACLWLKRLYDSGKHMTQAFLLYSSPLTKGALKGGQTKCKHETVELTVSNIAKEETH